MRQREMLRMVLGCALNSCPPTRTSLHAAVVGAKFGLGQRVAAKRCGQHTAGDGAWLLPVFWPAQFEWDDRAPTTPLDVPSVRSTKK